jgi:hypothetical protein
MNILRKKLLGFIFFIILRHINQQKTFKMKKLSIVAALLFAFGTVAFAQDSKPAEKKEAKTEKKDDKKMDKKSDKKMDKKDDKKAADKK